MTSIPRSALARPLDLRYPSNRVAALVSLAALLLSRRQGHSWPSALERSGMCFLTWAMARELDPDHPMTANLAMPLAFVFGPSRSSSTLAGFGVLSALRLLADTTGERPTQTDHLGMLVQAVLSARAGSGVAALMPAVASVVVTHDLPSALPLAALLVPGRVREPSGRWALLPLIAALAVTPALIRPEAVESACDRAPRTVRPTDLRRARAGAAAVLALGLLTRQPAGLPALASAVLSVGLRRCRTHGSRGPAVD
ncbi:hypothetical protein E7T09_03065 [Deinococcus sp. KSM4-11]|uniref:hypothetical protein n=1 Tax=Deinococcus sp. KSM4-11 TaxID=2568654 RepID=UPI0010A33A12|nr:hypothetical protein [Deinococcus sp. KSM4-11]THF88202.1 hypothetical protein E7T09_03065 [Deinococcus sp. KSM4-11]